MNLQKNFTKAFILTSALLFSNQAVIASGLNLKSNLMTEDEYRWCKDATLTLKAAYDSGIKAETYEEEVAIIKKGMEETLKILNPKFHYYFESTILLSLDIESKLTDTKDKAFFLRRNTQYAISDLIFLDQSIMSRFNSDYRIYAISLLERILNEGLRSKTDQIELMMLDAGANSVIKVLEESDYRRKTNYSCASVSLKEALKISNINYKKNLINSAITSLNGSCN